MFDPTIFDNLKVVLEGGIYDLEQNSQMIILDRKDMLDLAAMTRTFQMEMTQLDFINTATYTIELHSNLIDFAVELTELRLADGLNPGCRISVHYIFRINEMISQEMVEKIKHILKKNLGEDIHFKITFEWEYECKTEKQKKCVHLSVVLQNKIDDSQVDIMNELINHAGNTFFYLAHLLVDNQ